MSFESERRVMIRRAACYLSHGKLVALPTDTYYALCADVTNEKALTGVFAAKNRPEDRPLPVFIADLEDLESVARNIPEAARALGAQYWPGPLTLILKRRTDIPARVSAGQDTVGIRVPDHDIPRQVIRHLGRPITGTSANVSGQPPTKEAEETARNLGNSVELVIPGPCGRHELASTVVDMTRNVPVVLREGAISLTELKRTLHTDLLDEPLNRGDL